MKFINKTLITLCTLLINISTFNGNCSNNIQALQNEKDINNKYKYNIPLPEYCINEKISITEDEYDRYIIFWPLKNDLEEPFIPYNDKAPVYSTNKEFELYRQLMVSLAQSVALLKQDRMHNRNKISENGRAEVLITYMGDILDVVTTKVWQKYNHLHLNPKDPKYDKIKEASNKLMDFLFHYHNLIYNWEYLFKSKDILNMEEEFCKIVYDIMQ